MRSKRQLQWKIYSKDEWDPSEPAVAVETGTDAPTDEAPFAPVVEPTSEATSVEASIPESEEPDVVADTEEALAPSSIEEPMLTAEAPPLIEDETPVEPTVDASPAPTPVPQPEPDPIPAGPPLADEVLELLASGAKPTPEAAGLISQLEALRDRLTAQA